MKNESGSTTDSETKDEALEKVTAASFTPFIQQKHWRRVGVFCLFFAGGLAILAVSTNILRDSILSVALVFTDNTTELTPAYPLVVYILYWGFFLLLLVVAFYIVMIDLRYIRLDYVLEKRRLMKDSWEDEEIRKLMQAVQKKSRESEE